MFRNSVSENFPVEIKKIILNTWEENNEEEEIIID
jgi:hypothetical protein